MLGVLALGALGLAFVLKSQPSTAKTVTLEPNKIVKSVKPNAKNPSAKQVGSLEDLTKNAPEPRAVTTDAIVVPPKPAPTVSSVPEVVSAKPEVTTPVAVSENSSQTVKPAAELSKPIEKPQVSSRVEAPKVSSTIETPTSSDQSSSIAVQKPATVETAANAPAPILPLRRLEGSVSVQAGAFKNADNAEVLRAQLSSQGFKVSVEVGTDGISRVIVGPYPDEKTAREATNKIKP
jgi:cell division protein FtsN